MNVYEIGNKIQRLPEHLIPEVLDYIEFLINRYGDKQVEQNQKKKFKKKSINIVEKKTLNDQKNEE